MFELMKRFIFQTIIIFFCAVSLLSANNASDTLHEALFYFKVDQGRVQCVLCPRRCIISDGQRGFCGVRENQKGILRTLVYGKPCSLHIDPIEKKPLFHVLPGSKAFSLATVGCNLKCKFCQNWQISQARFEDVRSLSLSPAEVIAQVKEAGAPVIAFTYTEPTIYYEYMLDIARLSRKEGIKNVMHSAGFINEEPLRQLCPYLDAANIDLKGFSERFYSEATLGNLEDVLRSLQILKEEGVWIEITNLLIPGLNDDSRQIKGMCEWIRDHLGPDTPVHFSRFWPMHQLLHLSPTSPEKLQEARRIAKEAGLKHIYIGNVAAGEAEDTFCPSCGKKIVDRAGYVVTAIHVAGGSCEFCGEKIDGVWR